MKVYGGVNMATNNFLFKSLADLQKIAESYKTNLLPNLTIKQDPVYTIADVSKTDFDNISTFLYNSVIKDAKTIELNESSLSLEFSSYLLKYFDEGLTKGDIVALKKFVNRYNNIAFQYLVNNVGSYVFGLSTASREIDPLSFIGKMVNSIKSKLSYLILNAQDQITKREINAWFGETSTVDSTYNLKEFSQYLENSKIVESLVMLMIISYLSEDGVYFVSENTTLQNSGIKFSEEIFYKDNISNISSDIRDFYFTNKKAIIVTETFGNDKLVSIEIRNDNAVTMLKLPLRLLDSSDVIIEDYNFVSSSIINGENGEISFINLFSQLRSNLFAFIELIKINDFTNIKNINQLLYNSNLNYFLSENNVRSLASNISIDIGEIVSTFYYKDKIIDNFYTSFSNSLKLEKTSASLIDNAKAQSGDQITIIDVKDIDFSNSPSLDEAKSIFEESLGTVNDTETEITDKPINKLTYTVIYKELNPVLRQLCLFDIQEYKFSRLFKKTFNNNEKIILEVDKTETITYLNTLNNIYKGYQELNDVFEIENSIKYKYFYSNIYMARIANESDIIGYYIGDNKPESLFTNNYGYFDYQKTEITNFLEIYKTSRDYYYKVLLNKSFIQDEAYFLYEKLFIGWLAIERFLTLKLDNLRDPDSLNESDVYNFLESYGLGILNQYEFFLGAKNYKVNIIKNFANLNKLKGSKDVIDLLSSIFDVGDVIVDINKFLLVDEAIIGYDSLNVDIVIKEDSGSYELKYFEEALETPTGIKVYDVNRIYYNTKTFGFIDADGVNLNPQSTYYFDEEKYKLYDSSMTEINFTVYGSKALSDLVYYNESNGKFYLNNSEITPQFISVVSDNPRVINDGDIFYVISEKQFYRKNNKTCEIYKAYSYYPSIIEDNLGLPLIQGTTIYRDLSVYDNFTFYTGSYENGNLELYRYSFAENSLFSISFTETNDFPKEKYFINVPWWRFLIRAGFITRDEYDRNTKMLYRYISNNINNDKVFLNTESFVLSYFEFDDGSTKKLNLISRATPLESDLKFVEVPYSSDNGTREIKNILESSVVYEKFLEINEFEKIDPYWTKENVPQETLKEIGLDVVETKYLSLVVSENIYRKYLTARYILSTIEYLDTILIGEDSIVNSIILDSGLFQSESIYNYYQVVKILFKTVLKLYAVKLEETPLPLAEGLEDFKKYYGINANADWSKIEDYLAANITNFNSIKNEFLEADVSENADGSDSEKYDTFSLYEKIDTWTNFGNTLYYKQDKVIGKLKVLNNVAKILNSSLFSTHKLNNEIAQQNSGPYVLELFENLNWIRVSKSSGTPPIANKADNFFSLYLSKFFDINYQAFAEIPSKINDKTSLYFEIIEKIVKFPIDYIDGLLYESFTRESVNRNKKFVELMTLIFETVYMVDGTAVENDAKEIVGYADPALSIKDDEYFEGKTDVLQFLGGSFEILNDGTLEGDNLNQLTDTELDELITEYSEKLITVLGSLESVFSAETLMQISFALKENEQKTLNFLKQAIELFISYTAQLYSSRFIREYRTVSESPLMTESLKHKLKQYRTDYVFYDEKLEIKEVE